MTKSGLLANLAHMPLDDQASAFAQLNVMPYA
jgi:hypothetical protein